MTITLENFSISMEALFDGEAWPLPSSIAAGISGGPDSTALAILLAAWGRERNIPVHFLIVDHGLRPESAQEALRVSLRLSALSAHVHILRWGGEKPKTRVMEEARTARRSLMIDYMKNNDIKDLCLAHHADDQAETFLTRLAKGSGLDGLAGMKPRQEMEDDRGRFFLIRPLLGVTKDKLIATCETHATSFEQDPSNANEKYLRPRLRAMKEALGSEGLDSRRLSTTASRILRARTALEILSQDLFEDCLISQDKTQCSFHFAPLLEAPEELFLRVLLLAIARIGNQSPYGPRLERVENLAWNLRTESSFSRATLAGCIFALKESKTILHILKEAV